MRSKGFLVLGLLCIAHCEVAQAFEAAPTTTNRPAQALGTLVYTAAERQALTKKAAAQPTGASESAKNPATAQTTSNLRFDGFVRPAHGRPVIWVNGQIQNNDVALSQADDTVIIRVNQSQLESLSPGQSTQQGEFSAGNDMIIHRDPLPKRLAQSQEPLRRALPSVAK